MQSNIYQAKLKEIRSDLTKKYPRANIFEINHIAFRHPEVVYHLNDPAFHTLWNIIIKALKLIQFS